MDRVGAGVERMWGGDPCGRPWWGDRTCCSCIRRKQRHDAVEKTYLLWVPWVGLPLSKIPLNSPPPEASPLAYVKDEREGGTA